MQAHPPPTPPHSPLSHRMPTTNWKHLVGYDENDGDVEYKRIDTCVLCGDMQATNKRFVNIQFMYDAVNTEINIFKGTYMQSTYNNIYNLIKIYNGADDTCDVCVCINCYYWSRRHKSNNLIPTMYLKWYMNTLHNGSCKCFDKRVLWRICKTLLQTQEGNSNFYLSMFSEAEASIVKQIAENNLEAMTPTLHQFYKQQSANSLFHDHKLGAKCIRDMERQ